MCASWYCKGRSIRLEAFVALCTSFHYFRTSKEAVITSRLNCKCDRELYDSLHCRQRRIRVEASFHCMDRDTVKGVVLGCRFRGTLWIVTL